MVADDHRLYQTTKLWFQRCLRSATTLFWPPLIQNYANNSVFSSFLRSCFGFSSAVITQNIGAQNYGLHVAVRTALAWWNVAARTWGGCLDQVFFSLFSNNFVLWDQWFSSLSTLATGIGSVSLGNNVSVAMFVFCNCLCRSPEGRCFSQIKTPCSQFITGVNTATFYMGVQSFNYRI